MDFTQFCCSDVFCHSLLLCLFWLHFCRAAAAAVHVAVVSGAVMLVGCLLFALLFVLCCLCFVVCCLFAVCLLFVCWLFIVCFVFVVVCVL